MSEFTQRAHCGIIGIAPPPWNANDNLDWPTGGYDSPLSEALWEEEVPIFERTGYTREEWLALADEMIARWTAWKAHITELPDDT